MASRASKTKAERYSYLDDFDDDEDGKLSEHQNTNNMNNVVRNFRKNRTEYYFVFHKRAIISRSASD